MTGFLDLEMTQGPKYPKEEAISIGVVIIDDDNKEMFNFHSLCRPMSNPFVTSRITKMTGITRKQVKEAAPFKTVFSNLIKNIEIQGINVHDINFYSWGGSDKTVLDKCCNFCDIEMPLKIKNMQYLVLWNWRNGKSPLIDEPKSLERTAEFYNIPRFPAHNALDDARALSQIYTMLKEYGRYDYSKKKFEYLEPGDERNIIATDISREFIDAMKNRAKESVLRRYSDFPYEGTITAEMVEENMSKGVLRRRNIGGRIKIVFDELEDNPNCFLAIIDDKKGHSEKRFLANHGVCKVINAIRKQKEGSD